MGIEVPEELGGTGSSFFTAALVVEELSRSTRASACWSTCRTRWSTTACCATAATT
jgi:alkylation response protein AidB-like acyl-CoA dehydrogenase